MIRLGLIGCGGMSKNFGERFHKLAGRARVVATVDINGDRAIAAAQAVGAARVETDYHKVLEDIDAALIVLPHHLHHSAALACLAAGKHVLLEKPMANTEAECLDLIRAAKEADRVLMIAYVMRYHPLVIRLKELLDSRQYGECFQMSIWTEQFTRYPEDHWIRSAKLLGGGQLFSHGCHYIDLLLWFLGNPVEGTHMGSNFHTPWLEMEGTSNVTMKFESGAMGYHFGTWGARGTKLRYAIHAHCSEGMLEVDFMRGKLVLHRDPIGGLDLDPVAAHREIELQGGQEEILLQCETGKHTDKEMLHFLDCIETGATPQTAGEQSLQGLRVIWKLYEAERRGIVADLRGLGFEQAVVGSNGKAKVDPILAR